MLVNNYNDPEHNKLVIDSSNNTLILRPNYREDPLTITIPDGSYTMYEMRNVLDSLLQKAFQDAGLKYDFSTNIATQSGIDVWTEEVRIGNSDIATFSGLRIATNSIGLDSIVNIDPTSSAYATLFTDRSFIYYGDTARLTGNSGWDQKAWLVGGKELNGNVVLTDANNSFHIKCAATGAAAVEADIVLTAKTYTSLDDLKNEIQSKLDASSCTGLLKVSIENNKIRFDEAKDISGKIEVKASAASNGSTEATNGYKMLFVGETIQTDPKTVSGTGSVSFVTPGVASGSTMWIQVGGKSYDVTLSNPSDKAKIKEDIEKRIKGETIYNNNTFTADTKYGNTDPGSVKATSNNASTSTNPLKVSGQGTTSGQEGVAGNVSSTAASITINQVLGNNIKIDSSNNTFYLNINGKDKTLTLTEGTYSTPDDFKNELQRAINDQFGTGINNSATVTLDGSNRLVITTLRKGRDASVSYDTSKDCNPYSDKGGFIWSLRTNKTAASCTSNMDLGGTTGKITIGSDNNEFKFTYRNAAGVSNSYTLTLTEKTYDDRNAFITELNNQLSGTGTGVTASLSGNRLVLTSAEKGKNVLISYESSGIPSGGSGFSAADAMFSLVKKSEAKLKLDHVIQENITIETGKQEFYLNVNGTPTTITLTAGTYSRTGLKDEINKQLTAANVRAKAELDGNYLVFSTTDKGNGTSIGASYVDPDTGNPKSAMKAIFGVTATTYPSVTAEWGGPDNNTLTLTAGNGSKATIRVYSGSSAGLLEPTRTPKTVPESGQEGIHSTTRSTIDGVSFTTGKVMGVDTVKDTVKITENNNKLNISTYKRTSSGAWSLYTVNAVLRTGEYKYDELETELMRAMKESNSDFADDMEVIVNDNGVTIQAKGTDNNYKYLFGAGGSLAFSISGSFYRRVMSEAYEKEEELTATDARGTQKLNPAYTIGRKDVTSGVEIFGGVGDELSFDLTIGTKTHKIEIRLKPGQYSADELVEELQTKIDEKLVGLGFHAGVVKVGVGGINSGVAGGNDQTALNFRIAEDVQAPQEGDYVIDGVSGSAAFEIFYQTEGRIVPAYIMGAKEVVWGVDICEGSNDLTFDVDGDSYSITLPPGHYDTQELLDAFTLAFGNDIPLFASYTPDGRLKINYAELGHHEITSVSGGAKNTLFFYEAGGRDDTYRNIQLSSEIPDYIALPRGEFNTHMLRINTLTLATERGAGKAVDRISRAINRVSSLRSTYGSTQNRLEHAINNNNNKQENLEASESIIRDTDMASEMVRLTTLNILQQSGISVLTQANQKKDIVLSLLG